MFLYLFGVAADGAAQEVVAQVVDFYLSSTVRANLISILKSLLPNLYVLISSIGSILIYAMHYTRKIFVEIHGPFTAIRVKKGAFLRKILVFVTLILHVSLHLDGQVYLPFGVCLGVDQADAALKEVAPTHVHEDGELLIVGAGDIAEEYVLFGLLVIVDYLYGIGVVTVVGLTHEA